MIAAKAAALQMEIVTDPHEIAKRERRRAFFERNLAWFQSRAQEIYHAHRGKCICIAGQQLFVADSPQHVLAMARAAHPDDEGLFTRFIPQERLARIYAAQGPLAPLR
jgi:hypothetical protein